VSKVKVLNKQGIAIHLVPESCGVGSNPILEALTGGDVGRVLSREIHVKLRGTDPEMGWGAEPLEDGRRPRSTARYRECRRDPARSETPRMRPSTAYGNREIPRLTEADGVSARIGDPIRGSR
jgi:hypothetical protein